ncbi:MAG TPA: helix-turn-helix transcriptional regulator [Streptosporangiaceae bacterium]|nr:helix-turn-helix transcriptional regulator [Streptosporangiaceae bacterium]
MRRTNALVAVAAGLMSDPGGRHWGYELSRRSGVRSGVMYPVLQRMLDEGWLADGWEDQAEAGREKRPPRRYYEVTDLGRSELGALAARARADGKPARLAGGPRPGWAAG